MNLCSIQYSFVFNPFVNGGTGTRLIGFLLINDGLTSCFHRGTKYIVNLRGADIFIELSEWTERGRPSHAVTGQLKAVVTRNFSESW